MLLSLLAPLCLTLSPAMEITADTVLDPAQTYGPLIIKASNITLDGRGAAVVGKTSGDPREYTGTGIFAQGVSGVTLKNVRVKGWETGLRIEDGSGWRIEDCDLSDNFHDPAFGWGENGRRGGLVLVRVQHSTLCRTRANRVWDGCVLVESNDNLLENNDFSHTSNTCLKLWTACRNQIRNNVLSWGLRIDPGEVHARDSTCVLIESGSNDNRFADNDCTHGGDGIFVRVLNGWVSTGNVFERNDCSYANNNCIESWSPRNTYIGNKANHGSYGFWMGGSDQTVLEDNEASYNGLPTGMHNSPHLPGAGHAGIIFLFGTSSHTIARGNRCLGNNGAGIALVGDLDSEGRKWKAFHWIVEQNTLAENRWGVYVKHADWIDLAANVFRSNREHDVLNDGNVTNLFERGENAAVRKPPQAVLEGPARAVVGQAVVFDASASRDPTGGTLRFRWDLGDSTISDQPRVEHVFLRPGFHRVGLTVQNDLLSDLGWRDLYAVEDVVEFGTNGQAGQWSWSDPQSQVHFSDDREQQISGGESLAAVVQPYSGGRVSLLYPAAKDAAVTLSDKTHLVFWIRAINENVPAWQETNPLVTLYESETTSATLTPVADLMSQRPNSEEREGWTYFAIPLAGDEQWKRAGVDLKQVNYLTIGFDSWGAPPLRIWIDGLAWKTSGRE